MFVWHFHSIQMDNKVLTGLEQVRGFTLSIVAEKVFNVIFFLAYVGAEGSCVTDLLPKLLNDLLSIYLALLHLTYLACKSLEQFSVQKVKNDGR